MTQKARINKMTISEYIAAGYSIMTDANAVTYPFYSVDKNHLAERLLLHRYGMRELFYTNTDSLIQNLVQLAVKDLFDDNVYKWQKLSDSAALIYDPLHNTDLTITDTETNSGTDSSTDTVTNSGTDTTNTTTTPATVSTTAKRSYDAAAFNDTDKVTNSGTETNAGTVQHGHVITNPKSQTYGHVITTQHTETGGAGIDPQAAIEKERRIADFNLVSQIAESVANVISLLSYNFAETEYDSFEDYITWISSTETIVTIVLPVPQ